VTEAHYLLFGRERVVEPLSRVVSTTPTGEKAVALARMVEERRLRVAVDEVFEFEDALKVCVSV